MKKLILIPFLLSSLIGYSQMNTFGGIGLRVNDTTTYQTNAAAYHTAGYYDIYFNNQATNDHWDVWNGSSYDHIFSFGSGSGSGTVNSGTQYRIAYYIANGTTVGEAAAITGGRALKSDANGVPTHFDTATEPSLTELSYVKGVTSSIQTQINSITGLSGLTTGVIPVANSATTITNSGLRYRASPTSSLYPATSLVNIPGLTGTLPPFEMLNLGYFGTDTTIFPNNHLIRAPKGFVNINWSQNFVNNWVWDPVDLRAEPFNTNIAMIAHEIGGEGILSHYTKPGSMPSSDFHEITRFGGGVDGVTGIHPYTTQIPFNQFKSTIFLKWASTTTPPVGTEDAWWGGTNNVLGTRLNPGIWMHRDETKSVSTNDFYNEDIRLDGFGTFLGLNFGRSNGTYNAKTILTTGQQIGDIGAIGYDGATYQKTGSITFLTRGTPSAGVVPTSILFRTSATNTAGLTNRVEISSTGNVGFGIIGSLTQTAKVHIAAGTTSAGSGPLKLTEGSNPTSAEDGLINYVSNNLTFTETSTVYTLAKTLTGTGTLNFDLTSVNSEDLTITVTGAADGDAVAFSVPAGSATANVIFTAWVSGANTVTVRASRIDVASGADPASGTFRASVIKY